jgi:P-type Ca2+ transporter type 2C
VESLLEISPHHWIDGQIKPLDEAGVNTILAANQALAQAGMRVLGVAWRGFPSPPDPATGNDLEQNLIFIGVIGMQDLARPEVKPAVLTCKAAGIRPVMITGDQPLTAQHIAHELAMTDGQQPVTGQALAQFSGEELSRCVATCDVYARVSPQQKLAIIQALQDQGQIVAMTGDGINDAPALRKADIGVAMGITGTDVAKEAADMVLLDDNFATIVAAVREGRVIYDNIRKSIKYLLSSNSGEIWVMLLAPLLGMPLPLLPIQILWINLLTDGLPALALSVEPAEWKAMERSPYPPTASMIGRRMGMEIVLLGLLTGFICVGMGYWYWRINPEATWQTMVFTTLTIAELGIVLAMRSEQDSILQLRWHSHQPLLGAVLLTFGLQLCVIYVPVCQQVFMTESLAFHELGFCVLMGSIVMVVIELKKLIFGNQDLNLLRHQE